MMLNLRRLRLAGLVMVITAAAACAVLTPPPPSAEKDRLVAAGYRVVSQSPKGYALVYSGPPTAEITCRRGRSGAFRPLPDTRVAGGARILYRSDVRVTLTAAGAGAPLTRDAFYVVTEVRRPTGRNQATLQTISFADGGQARFRSGLTCRAG